MHAYTHIVCKFRMLPRIIDVFVYQAKYYYAVVCESCVILMKNSKLVITIQNTFTLSK